MPTLVLIRHGESEWNKEGRFTGWVDVDLTKLGQVQAHKAGEQLKDLGFSFDIAYTSVLKRAIRTLWQIQEAMDLMWIPIIHSWRLNERHYGALSGLSKAQTAQKYGEACVHSWRRSYRVAPPTLSADDVRASYHDPRYALLKKSEIPLTECLFDTVNRILPLWEHSILPALRAQKRILIAAHGNSLRAFMKIIAQLSEEEIVEINIPNATPLIIQLDDQIKLLDYHYLDQTVASSLS